MARWPHNQSKILSAPPLAFVQCFARQLVQAFDLIGRCGAWTFPNTHHLERTALDLGGHQAACKRAVLAL